MWFERVIFILRLIWLLMSSNMNLFRAKKINIIEQNSFKKTEHKSERSGILNTKNLYRV